MYKKNIKRIISLIVMILLLGLSTTYASTINESDISINIDINGTCNIEEMLYVTAIDDSSDYTTRYFGEYSSIQLTRGANIEKLCINNSEISKNDIDKYYNDYVGIINLSYPQARKISLCVILHKKNKYNLLSGYASIRSRINIWRR